MQLSLKIGFTALLAALLTTAPEAQNATDRNWPTWRGPAGIGISTTANPPTEWSETKNVRWKVEIPGRGH